MATPVIMPKQGQTVESCVLTAWYKEVGESVEKGDLLFSYETDKASFDEEAQVEGIILDIFFEEWDEVPVLANVCVIGEVGEETAEFNPHVSDEEPTEKEVESVPVVVQSPPAEEMESKEERLKISPRARRLAEDMGVDSSQVTPSGPQERIIARDILAAKPAGPVGDEDTADYETVELSRARLLIGERMTAAFTSVPQVVLNTSFDASQLLAFRKELKAAQSAQELNQITINDMLVYAVSRTILNYRELNAHFVQDKLHLYHHAHIGVAVDTERGLLVPTLFKADQKSLQQISKETRQLIEQSRQGNINPDYLQGGTFTVTNLGSLGIESFAPIINLPQTGILGVNSITWQVKEEDGKHVYYPAMGLSLVFDHRALDGAFGARFLQELTVNLEQFTLLLCR